MTNKKKYPTLAPTPKPKKPVLRFSPTAWAKLLYLRDAGATEIGGFGITTPDDLLRVEDIVLIGQTCSVTHVEFDDSSVADFFDEQVDAGRQPEEFGRIWVHTHPGSSAEPSRTDEITFGRAFGQVNWSVMFILARGGQTYSRLRYNFGPGADVVLPVEVDFSPPFQASAATQWQAEYHRCVRAELPELVSVKNPKLLPPVDDFLLDDWYEAWEHYVDDSAIPSKEMNYEFDREF